MRLGEWDKVVQLLSHSGGSDAMMNRAYKNLGDYSAERQRWSKAAKFYKLCNDYEALAHAYFKMEDFNSLQGVIKFLPEASPILEILGEKF